MKKLVKLAVATAVVFGASSAMADNETVVKININDRTCTILDKDGTQTDNLAAIEVTETTDETAVGAYTNTLEDTRVFWCKTITANGTLRKAEKYSADDVGYLLDDKSADAVCEVTKANGTTVLELGVFKNVITPSGTSTLTCTHYRGNAPLEDVEDDD